MQREKDLWNARATEDIYGAVVTSQPSWEKDEYYKTGQDDFERFIAPMIKGMDTSHMTALDFGCGTGRIARYMKPVFGHVIGVDISDVLLAQGHIDNPEIEYHLTDGESLEPIASDSVDFVFSYGTFQHFTSHTSVRKIMREIHRVMKVGAIAHFDLRARPGGARGAMAWWIAFDRFYAGIMLWHRCIPIPFYRAYDPLSGACFKEEQIRTMLESCGLTIKDIGEVGKRSRWATVTK